MKRLLVLSGKGGTGKTTVSSYIIARSGARAYADCDVDAPNLHIVTSLDVDPIDSLYWGSNKAKVDEDKCIGCGACFDVCRFDSIRIVDGKALIDEFGCEGCGACSYICPQDAVGMEKDMAGRMELQKDYEKVFSTATLRMGRGNSGKLVSEVKKVMNENAFEDTELAVIDGSPGIGCPVIASISGVDLVLLVTEPSMSGLSDLERIVKTCRMFNTPMGIVVNKADLQEERCQAILDFAEREGITFLGRIPYDRTVFECVNSGRTVLGTDSDAEKALERIYENAMELLASLDKEK